MAANPEGEAADEHQEAKRFGVVSGDPESEVVGEHNQEERENGIAKSRWYRSAQIAFFRLTPSSVE